MIHRESKLQQACIKWLRLQYPKIVAFAIPNGGKRNVREAARMKAEGVLAGVPDLFIASPRGGYCGMFIEMKAGKAKPTDAQDAMLLDLGDEGYRVLICRDFDVFRDEVTRYLNDNPGKFSDNDPVQLMSA